MRDKYVRIEPDRPTNSGEPEGFCPCPSRAAAQARARPSALYKRQQIRVDRGSLGGRHAVREALVGFQSPVLHQLGAQRTRVGVGHDLVIIAVHD
jgi:hypothetical protein